MLGAFFPLALKRDWLLVVLVGLAAFAVGFGALVAVAPGWAAAAIATTSETAVTTILAVFVALFAMSLTGVLLVRQLRRGNDQVHTAIDSMAQGLCMFDASERLVVCNSKYSEMYKLTSDDVKPGTKLSDVLTKRVAKGTFAREPEQYRKEFLAEIA